jgi:GntR family transcriptional regulator
VSEDVLHSSPGKLYLHVADLIRGRMRSGEWAAGDKLPTISELAAEFGVATVTVRQAIAILEAEGRLRRQQGVGTFATAGPAASARFTVGLDWPALLDVVNRTVPRLIRKQADIALPLRDPEGRKQAPSYQYLKRVNALDDLDCLVTDAYIDSRIYARMPERFDRETILPLIESLHDVTIAECRQILTIGQATIETARLLNIAVNSPMGDVRRILTAPDHTILYLSDTSYRGDMVRFEVALVPGPPSPHARMKEARR